MKEKDRQALTIGFIGLGLIGGSIAKSIKRIFPIYNIIGFDINSQSLKMAVQDKILNQAVNDLTEMKACDYIFLCAPVHYNIQYLETLKHVMKPNCILTDVGSVKNDICRAITNIGLEEHFVGGHPMVGSEHTGYESSNDRLIENAYYFITPTAKVNQDCIETFKNFIKDLGAIPIIYSPKEHDEITAYISHIPHVIASGLVNLAAMHDTENGIYKQLAAGGFKDITRIASSSALIWEHILLSNADDIIQGLQKYIHEIDQMIQAIQAKDSRYIYDYFEQAKSYRNAIPDSATGAIEMHYDLYVDIPDEAGVLAKIADIIFEASINLKNIGITHNREDHQGVLRLSFDCSEDMQKAHSILKNTNYKVYKR